MLHSCCLLWGLIGMDPPPLVRPSSPPSLCSLPAPMSTTHSRQVPLILGIWGPKGMGKTFQTELALKKMGVEAVVMSAGELEHEWAGTPGRLIRERYRKAADMSKVRGIMTTLLSECFVREEGSVFLSSGGLGTARAHRTLPKVGRFLLCQHQEKFTGVGKGSYVRPFHWSLDMITAAETHPFHPNSPLPPKLHRCCHSRRPLAFNGTLLLKTASALTCLSLQSTTSMRGWATLRTPR